ncbi:MAG TPA: alpha/beta hydrolase [Syntrophales bacterium]|nr:alpha/beta hydrolase [Syntrophales bacterium]
MTVLMGALMGFGIWICIVLIYLIVIIFLPVLSVPEQPIYRQSEDLSEDTAPPPYRHDVEFSVSGTTIRAWLYLPEDTARPVPCVIMSTGFGGTKDGLLESYAVRFVEAGLAVLSYDYRHFGESDGEPRQVYDVSYQLDDLRAAVDYARSRNEIDAEKIVLWSTSAAGGYGLVIAAEDERIAAVISQCGAIDHKVDGRLYLKREGYCFFLRLFVHAQRDKGRSRFGLSPHTFPIVGRPGSVAMFTAPEAFEGYARLVQSSKTFRNEVCARLFFMKHGPDPVEVSQRVQCPVLFLTCEYDNLAAPDSYKRAAEALGDKAEVISFPIRHFDIYEGEYFEKATGAMISFMKNSLRLPTA